MTATTEPPAGGGPLKPSGDAIPAPEPATLIGAPSSYLCANCSAELAVDQHYCVECGARRGKPRFTLAAPVTAETGLVAVAPRGLAPRGGGLPPRVTALLAAVVVLLALGVGVLIGESGNSVKVSSVTVAAGGSGTSGAGTAGKASTTGSSSKSSSGSTKSTTTGSSSSAGYSFGN